jgi:hypothetical protein
VLSLFSRASSGVRSPFNRASSGVRSPFSTANSGRIEKLGPSLAGTVS